MAGQGPGPGSAASDALDLVSILHSNRSAAYASLHCHREALADAARAVELRPNWSKAYSRLAVAHVGLGRLDDAFSACKKCIEIDPGNDVIKSTLVHALTMAAEQYSSSAEFFRKLRADVVVAGYLQQEEFVKKMREVQKNPSSVKMYLVDQRMMRALGVLLNLKVRPQEASSWPESSGRLVAPEQQMEMRDLLARALLEKDAGNAAYGKKDFEIAIRHYTRGLELVRVVLSSHNNTNMSSASTGLSSQYTRSRVTTMQPQSNTLLASQPQNAHQVERNLVDTPICENEVRVAAEGGVHSYITYATGILQEKCFNEVVFKGMGRAISNTVMIVEMVKRNIVGLHQNTAIGSVDMTERWEPVFEGLHPIETTRQVSVITITLSKKELDPLSPGVRWKLELCGAVYIFAITVCITNLYQSPLCTKNINQHTEVSHGETFPRGRGRGKNVRGRGRSRGNGTIVGNYKDRGRENNGRPYNVGLLGCKQGRGFRDHGPGRKVGQVSHHHNMSVYRDETLANVLFGQGSGTGKEEDEHKNIVETNSEYDDDNYDVIDDDDDDCVMLASNPFEEETINNANLPRKLPLDSKGGHYLHQPISSQQCLDEDEISIIAERGQVACRDYPHSRHLCGQYPFDKTAHETYCSQCYCYVCDTAAPCKYWHGVCLGHCNATEFDTFWMEMRTASRATPTRPVLF